MRAFWILVALSLSATAFPSMARAQAVPSAFEECRRLGLDMNLSDVTYLLGRG